MAMQVTVIIASVVCLASIVKTDKKNDLRSTGSYDDLKDALSKATQKLLPFSSQTATAKTTSAVGSSHVPSTVAQVSLYVGLFLFSFVVIIICVIATIVSTPAGENETLSSGRHQRRRRFCLRFLSTRELPEQDNATDRIEHRPASAELRQTISQGCNSANRSCNTIMAAALRYAPPSYDDVVSVRSTTGSEHSLVSAFVDNANRPAAPSTSPPFIGATVGNARQTSPSTSSLPASDTVDRRPTAMIPSRNIHQTNSGIDRENGVIVSATATSGNLLASAGRRFLDRISPPKYFQVIRDMARHGIVINRALLTSPPPAYNELMNDSRGYRRRAMTTSMTTTDANSDRDGHETSTPPTSCDSNAATAHHGNNSNYDDITWKSPYQLSRQQTSSAITSRLEPNSVAASDPLPDSRNRHQRYSVYCSEEDIC